MPLNLSLLSKEPDTWWLEDEGLCQELGVEVSELGIEGVPCTYEHRDRVNRLLNVELKTDGSMMAMPAHQVRSVALELGVMCFKRIHGVEVDGKPIECNRKTIKLLVGQYGNRIVAPAVMFFQDLFEERKRDRQEASSS